jgi:lipoprotein-anchoring transpeptidase ErfK/SrfK
MRSGKLYKRLLYFFLAIMMVASGYAMFVYASEKPPLDEIGKARIALADAKAQLAGKYAGESLKEAEKYFNQALEEWQKQNSIFFVFRNYSLTSDLALKSYDRAVTALEEAGKSKSKLRYNAEDRLNSLRQKISHFEKYYKNLPLKPATLKLFNTGKTKYLEASIEFKSDEYINALKLILKAEENITQAVKQAHLRLAEFYRDYPVWEKNVKTAYQLSKKGQTVFLVDKLNASLTILKSGKEYKTIPVEFGENWMGDKMMAGDKATPEGIYKVQVKKDRSRTIYYKALLIDYPNREDQKRYNHLVQTGKISKNKGIGNLIEIHGEGGKGIHWTDGCIAMDNKDMDLVFSQSSVNTPVIIVGARQTLEEYLN